MIAALLAEKLDGRGKVFLIFLALLAVLVPICNLIVPASSAFHIGTGTVVLLGKWLCYAMLAVALDLVWGYCGILSLGHGALSKCELWPTVRAKQTRGSLSYWLRIPRMRPSARGTQTRQSTVTHR